MYRSITELTKRTPSRRSSSFSSSVFQTGTAPSLRSSRRYPFVDMSTSSSLDIGAAMTALRAARTRRQEEVRSFMMQRQR